MEHFLVGGIAITWESMNFWNFIKTRVDDFRYFSNGEINEMHL